MVGVACQCLILASTFASRTVFVKQLGAEYLGINSLFSNVLAVLAVTEMGIGNILLYSLYKPLYEQNYEKIGVILRFFKKIYYWIAAGIFIFGIVIAPALIYITTTSVVGDHELLLYYSLFLFNAAISYFVVHKTILINADQRIFIVQLANTGSILVRDVCQIAVLFVTGNYLIYLIVQIITTILYIVIINVVANKLYPFLLIKSKWFIAADEKFEIKKNLKAIFIYRVSVLLMNYTDNILISAMLGTIIVGYYSNYLIIISAIISFINILIHSMYSSIGNRNASQDSEGSFSLFRFLVFMFHWISTVSSVCIIVAMNDFIAVWIGEQYVLSDDVLISIVVNFFVQVVITPVWVYRETIGIFDKVKYVMLMAAIINIVLSVILGKMIGLPGIIIATAIARILTNVWYEPRLLFRLKFEKPVKIYWTIQSKYIVITMMCIAFAFWLNRYFGSQFVWLLLKIGIAAAMTTLLFFVLNVNSFEMQTARLYWKELLNKKGIKKV